MNALPLVSVNMIAYNRAEYIRDAIDSILAQDYENLELVIIDDGSTDETISVVKAYKNKKIILHKNEGNKGIAYSRNKAVSISTGEFILILDSDDIAHENLISKKIKFLISNPDYVGVSNLMTYINGQGKILSTGNGIRIADSEIPFYLFFSNCLVQSSIMLRSGVLKNNFYNEGVKSEDYDLWIRIIGLGKFHIIHEDLVKVRFHRENSTSTPLHDPNEGMLNVIKSNLILLDMASTDESLRLHRSFLDSSVKFTIEEFENFIIYINRVLLKKFSGYIFGSEQLEGFIIKRLAMKIKTNLKSLEIFTLWKKIFTIKINRSFRNNILLMLQKLMKDKIIGIKNKFSCA